MSNVSKVLPVLSRERMAIAPDFHRGVSKRNSRLAKGLMLASTVLAASGFVAEALAQEPVTGFYVGAGISEQYDSNVLRVPSGTGTSSDEITDTELLAGFDRTYSRQHLTASATVARVLFGHLSEYDYTRQDLRADWKANFPADINTELGPGHAGAM
jgi:hypothetical protein